MHSLLRSIVVLVLASPSFAAAPEGESTLLLTIRDTATGREVPARVEVRDKTGRYHIAGNALRFGGDCDMSDAGAGYGTLDAAVAGFTDRLENPYTRSTQFYSTGQSSVRVPSGAITVRVYKGPEYRVSVSEIEIEANEHLDLAIDLERWIDMPSKDWYSADDHLHIQRPHPDLDVRILAMMQAEDIHVANLLQMGKVRNFEIAPQYAFGADGRYQEGNYILAPGQENPRTHFLGHTITLGAPEPLFDADRYLVYRLIWEPAASRGGINGFAHAYFPAGSAAVLSPYDGMAVVLPHGLLHFLEVLQFNRAGYEAWYDVLNLGFRVAPTAGTDYPCADQSIAGHERFYTRVAGELTYEKWLDGVRGGRTFVTTGPMAQFRVDDVDIGGERRLEGPGLVEISGTVTFDPSRDAVEYVEIVQNGSPVQRFSRLEGSDRIEFSVRRHVEDSSWFAMRAFGSALSGGFVTPIHFGMFDPTSNVHTAPVYVLVDGRAGIGESPEARRVAREWLARLVDLETVLQASNLAYLGARLDTPTFDAVPPATLMSNREALLAEIATAKAYFERLAR